MRPEMGHKDQVIKIEFVPPEKAKQKSSCCLQLCNRRHRKAGVRLLSKMHSGRMKGNRNRLQNRKFQLD